MSPVDGVVPPAVEGLSVNQLARRTKIVQAALAALSESSYESVMMTDVARTANVALATVYRYFSSKEHLFANVFTLWQEQMRARRGPTKFAGKTESEQLKDAMHRTITAFQRQPHLLELLIMLDRSTDPDALVTSLVHDRVFKDILSTIPADPDSPEWVSIVLTVNSVMMVALRHWWRNSLSITEATQMVDDAVDLIYSCPSCDSSVRA